MLIEFAGYFWDGNNKPYRNVIWGRRCRSAGCQGQLRAGKGMLKVAAECGVGSGTVQRIAREMTRPFVGASVAP